VVTYGALTRL